MSNSEDLTGVQFVNGTDVYKRQDARIVKLVYKFLKAGYLEDWVYHKTYSGTPQGGILSPVSYTHLAVIPQPVQSTILSAGISADTGETRQHDSRNRRQNH